MYESGQGTLESEEHAIYWYLKAAEKGDVFAQTALGSIYQLSKLFRDYEKAFYWYQMAANKGDADAQYELGYMKMAQGSKKIM